jgi:hypothetical protein
LVANQTALDLVANQTALDLVANQTALEIQAFSAACRRLTEAMVYSAGGLGNGDRHRTLLLALAGLTRQVNTMAGQASR